MGAESQAYVMSAAGRKSSPAQKALEAAGFSTGGEFRAARDRERNYFAGGTRTSGEGAVYKRILTTTHALLGTQIKDVAVSDGFPDVYDGQCLFFPIFERDASGATLSEGEIAIGDSIGSCDYLIETPVNRKPLFGSGTLFGLDLNIYHDNINFNNQKNLPDIEVYKFKSQLGTQGTFGDARVDSSGDSNLMCGSSSYSDIPEIFETFDGIDPIDINAATTTSLSKNQTGGIEPAGDLYLTLEDAWFLSHNQKDGCTDSPRTKTKGAFRKRYCQNTQYKGMWICTVQRIKGYAWNYEATKGNKYSKRDPSWSRRYYDYDYAVAQGQEDNFIRQCFHTKDDSGTPVVEERSAETPENIELTSVTTENSIFKSTSKTNNKIRLVDGGKIYEAYTRSFFSSADAPPSGSAWKNDLFWAKNTSWSEEGRVNGGKMIGQCSMSYMILPKPLRISRLDSGSEADADDYQADSLEVDIKFSIINMNKYHKSNIDTTSHGEYQYGHNLLRSFVILASSRPPKGGESLAGYLENIGNPTIDKYTNPINGVKKNNINGVAFLRQGTTNNSTDHNQGDIKMVMSGLDDSRYTAFRGDADLMLPYIYKDNAAEEEIRADAIPTQEKIEEGEYYTLKMIINYRESSGKGDIVWVLLDSENKIIASRKSRHGGTTQTSTELESNEGAGFPAYLSFWINNAPVGAADELIGEEEGAIYASKSADSQVNINIDSIRVTGFEGGTQNASRTTKNSSPQPFTINPETDENMIDTDGTFTNGEEMPTHGADGEKHPIPNYLVWGTKSNVLTAGDKINNVFMGDFSTVSASLDASSTWSASTGNTTTSDIILMVPDNAGTMGSWFVLDREVNLQTDPHHNNALTLTGTNYVEFFRQKGFYTTDFSSVTDPANYVARECPAFSTKITKIENNSKGKIKVAQLSKLLGEWDEEYIIYRAGQAFGNSVYKTVTITNIDDNENVLTCKGSTGSNNIKRADDNSTDLVVNSLLPELYISPKRFWWAIEIYNVDSSTDIMLPKKTYGYSLIQQGVAPGSTTLGMTFNETIFSDTTANSNRWNIDKDGGLVETATNFGFGARGEDSTVDFEQSSGYIAKYSPVSGYNDVNLDGYISVESSRLEKPDEKINLFVSAAPEVDGSCAIRTTKFALDGTSFPYFTFYYYDERPTLSNFIVKPYEADPFYPSFTWDTQDEDLWYGFLLISNKEIKHQYDGAVAHIPLNEKVVTDNAGIKLYRYDGTRSGVAVDGVTGGALNNLTSAEGLAGNAFKGDGAAASWVAFGDAGSSTWTHPTNELSVIAHFTCDSIAGNRYIVSKLNEFEIYIDTSGYINALVKPQGGTAVTLKSTSLIVVDGETPVNAIITLDTSLATGNVKLFINGKLEDQSGKKLTTGTANNWHSANLNNDLSSVLTVGRKSGATSYHSGTVEEIVIYDKCIYPVVPQTGEFTLYKPYAELNPQGNPQSGITNVARLFIKDYHNIRGTLSNEVTASSMVSWRKSGLGLKSI